MEEPPADQPPVAKRPCLAVVPDDIGAAGLTGGADLDVEDDVRIDIAPVARGPAVVLPFLDPAAPEHPHALRSAQDSESRQADPCRVDLDIRIEVFHPGP